MSTKYNTRARRVAPELANPKGTSSTEEMRQHLKGTEGFGARLRERYSDPETLANILSKQTFR